MDKDKEQKSYMVDIKMEIVATSSYNVESIRIHGFSNEDMPLTLWSDFLIRFGQMTPGKDVMFVNNGKRITQGPITTTNKKWEQENHQHQ